MKKIVLSLGLLFTNYELSHAQWSINGNSNLLPGNFLGTITNHPLKIRTNNIERMTILNTNGAVGIGITNPVGLLHVNGDFTFGSATNGRKWRMVTQNWLANGKMFLLPDDAAGNLDYTRALTIDPNPALTSFTFGDGGNITNTVIGKATSVSNFGTTYLGFNASLDNTALTISRIGNGSANGGSIIWSNVDGHIGFTSLKSSGVGAATNNIADVYDTRSMTIKKSSTGTPQVLIGKDDNTDPLHKDNYALAVDGKLIAKEIYVTVANWPDYVFSSDYKLRSLKDVETFIKLNKHLPEVPAASDVEAHGINAAETDKLIMKKIEELTLYIIEQGKRIEELEKFVK